MMRPSDISQGPPRNIANASMTHDANGTPIPSPGIGGKNYEYRTDDELYG